MRSGGSPEKGGKFERDVCRRLSLWVTSGRSADVFWRSATSGARATVQLKSGKVNAMQSGDICAVDPRGYPFAAANFVEVKHRKDLGIARGFICETGQLFKFWQRACVEAAKYDKHPLLIAKQNLYPTLAIVYESDEVFRGSMTGPVITLHNWWASGSGAPSVYLFDEVTKVSKKLIRRTAA